MKKIIATLGLLSLVVIGCHTAPPRVIHHDDSCQKKCVVDRNACYVTHITHSDEAKRYADTLCWLIASDCIQSCVRLQYL